MILKKRKNFTRFIKGKIRVIKNSQLEVELLKGQDHLELIHL